jgi:hypothetical protein
MWQTHGRVFLFWYKKIVITCNGNECESVLLGAGHKIQRIAIGEALGS